MLKAVQASILPAMVSAMVRGYSETEPANETFLFYISYDFFTSSRFFSGYGVTAKYLSYYFTLIFQRQESNEYLAFLRMLSRTVDRTNTLKPTPL